MPPHTLFDLSAGNHLARILFSVIKKFMILRKEMQEKNQESTHEE